MSFKASVLLTLVIVANVALAASPKRPLKQHEIYATCASRCPIICDNYKNPPICPLSCAPPDYQCENGYYRRSDGECVLESECPGPHEKYTTCLLNCPLTCENYQDPPMCIESCDAAGYQCENGYVRREDGACVLETECPGAHEVYSSCLSSCPVTCDNYQDPPMCIESCESAGYECENGYVCRIDDGACVLESECPGQNEVYSICTSSCPATCDNYNKEPQACISSCGPAGYECESGYIRRDDGACVLDSQCPGPHEIYSECLSNCPLTCENFEYPPICPRSCNGAGYMCESGYVRREDGACILESKCPGPHEIYSECLSNCPLTCENYQNPPNCPRLCNGAGNMCENGYVRRSDDGACVLESECPGPHEVYTSCLSSCPDTCENYENPPNCILTCDSAGYQCESGYVRRDDGACVLEAEC